MREQQRENYHPSIYLLLSLRTATAIRTAQREHDPDSPNVSKHAAYVMNETRVVLISNAVSFAAIADRRFQERIMPRANSRKNVMFDLEVQPTRENHGYRAAVRARSLHLRAVPANCIRLVRFRRCFRQSARIAVASFEIVTDDEDEREQNTGYRVDKKQRGQQRCTAHPRSEDHSKKVEETPRPCHRLLAVHELARSHDTLRDVLVVTHG